MCYIYMMIEKLVMVRLEDVYDLLFDLNMLQFWVEKYMKNEL